MSATVAADHLRQLTDAALAEQAEQLAELAVTRQLTDEETRYARRLRCVAGERLHVFPHTCNAEALQRVRTVTADLVACGDMIQV